MIHTDAIEETEEPPKKLKVELVEEPEPPQMPETKEIVEEPKEPEEGLYLNCIVTLNSHTLLLFFTLCCVLVKDKEILFCFGFHQTQQHFISYFCIRYK